MRLHPGFLLRGIVGMEPAREIPQVLAGVIEIDDLHRAREVLVGQIPYPFGSVAYNNFLFRAAPTPVPCLQVDSPAERFGCLDGSGVGGRIGISNRVALRVPRILGEYASELDFTRMSRQTVGLALAPLGFLCRQF